MASSAGVSSVFDTFDAAVEVYGPYGPRGAAAGASGGRPRLSSAYLCLKVLLMAANVALLVFAIVLLALGSYALSSSVNALTGVTLPAGLICLGAFILVLAAGGALSVWKESRVGLALYLIALSAIAIALFALSIAVYVKAPQASTYIQQGWALSPPDLKRTLEIQFACCGLSAFPANATQAGCPTPDLVTIPPGQTCMPLFVSAFTSNYIKAGGSGIAFAVLMGAIAAFVLLLLKGISRRRAALQAESARLAEIEAAGLGAGQSAPGAADIDGLMESGDLSEDDDDNDEDDEGDEDDDTAASEGNSEETLPRNRPTGLRAGDEGDGR